MNPIRDFLEKRLLSRVRSTLGRNEFALYLKRQYMYCTGLMYSCWSSVFKINKSWKEKFFNARGASPSFINRLLLAHCGKIAVNTFGGLHKPQRVIQRDWWVVYAVWWSAKICWVQKQYFSPAGNFKTDFNWLPVASMLSSIPLSCLCLFVKKFNLPPRGCDRDRRPLKCLKSSAVLNYCALCLSSQIWKCATTSNLPVVWRWFDLIFPRFPRCWDELHSLFG